MKLLKFTEKAAVPPHHPIYINPAYVKAVCESWDYPALTEIHVPTDLILVLESVEEVVEKLRLE